jgi:hypothetical protein
MIYINYMSLIVLLCTCIRNSIGNALEIKNGLRTILEHLYNILLMSRVWILLENT